MTLGPRTSIMGPPEIRAVELPRYEVRLTLQPEGSNSGRVDGAWWPRSLDLTIELPSLLTALTDRLGSAVELTYQPNSWNATVRHLVAEGHVARLAGVASQPVDVITLIGADRKRLCLLVIPPDATRESAHRAAKAVSARSAPTPVECSASHPST
jgi:uncharacterized protein DUF5994